jgi:hypothetical protein
VGDVTCVLLGAEANGRIVTTTNMANEIRQLICAAIDPSFVFLNRAAKRLGAKRAEQAGGTHLTAPCSSAAFYF